MEKEISKVKLQHKCEVSFEKGNISCKVFYAGLCVKDAKTRTKALKNFIKCCKNGRFNPKFCY